MSVAPAFEVRCDCPGCPGCDAHGCTVKGFGTCGVAAGDYGPARVIRARARGWGWKVGLRGGKDACDDCAPYVRRWLP